MLWGQGMGLGDYSEPTVSYEHGEFQTVLKRLYDLTGNQTYFDYIVQGIDHIIDDDGNVGADYSFDAFSLDPIGTGTTLLYLYNQTGLEKYKTAADTFRRQLDEHPRTAQGQFWHQLIYPNQGWLDGIYMGELFYAQYTATFEPTNQTAWDDINAQFQLMFTNTLQNATAPNTTGLLYHGYDFSHTAPWASADRGHFPEVWDRAMGWYAMALVDVLDILSSLSSSTSTVELRTTLLSYMYILFPRIRDAASPINGVWWLVMTQPGRTGNYFESSAAAMFVYALLRGVRMGYVVDDPDEGGSLTEAAKRAYEYILGNWVVENVEGTMGWEGTVATGSLDTTGDFDYYINQQIGLNDLKGLASFALASLEYEML
ncbi:Unsaturated rhamnogalacturonyl hydrolase yteR [Termitomyces sp. J132]|nr:Unsaturated rhamnogalacturonyl hydrolase yteR [Termitomyces sp. J132]